MVANPRSSLPYAREPLGRTPPQSRTPPHPRQGTTPSDLSGREGTLQLFPLSTLQPQPPSSPPSRGDPPRQVAQPMAAPLAARLPPTGGGISRPSRSPRHRRRPAPHAWRCCPAAGESPTGGLVLQLPCQPRWRQSPPKQVGLHLLLRRTLPWGRPPPSGGVSSPLPSPPCPRGWIRDRPPRRQSPPKQVDLRLLPRRTHPGERPPLSGGVSPPRPSPPCLRGWIRNHPLPHARLSAGDTLPPPRNQGTGCLGPSKSPGRSSWSG